MAKYIVLKEFVDKYTSDKYKINQEIDMTVKRANEAEANLSKFGGGFLKRIDTIENDKPEETKAEDKETAEVIKKEEGKGNKGKKK